MDKIMRMIGYSKINDDNILNNFVGNLPDISDEFTADDEQDLMLRLSNVDGFKTWINFVVHRDMKNHYVALNDKQRDMIRGGSQRMLDILKRINSAQKPKQEVTRISGVRYGH